MASSRDNYLEFGPYQELLTGIRTALTINEGIIKLVGPEGAGKSALCRHLAAELAASQQDVVFFDTPPESAEFLQRRIQSQLGLSKDRNFNRELTQYLLAKPPQNRKLTIIYDDAERIGKDIFIYIRLLSNIHDESETLVSQVICGTPQLDERFDDPELRSLTQYLNQSFNLPLMTRDQLEDFCAGYIKLYALQATKFGNKDITDIFMQGEGMPGESLALLEKYFGTGTVHAQTAETAAEQDGLPVVDEIPAVEEVYAREVNEILKEDPVKNRSFSPVYFKAALSILVLVSTIVLMVVLSGDNEPASVTVTQVEEDEIPVYLDEVDDDFTGGPVQVAAENNEPTEVSLPALAAATGESPVPENEEPTEVLPGNDPAPEESSPSPEQITVAENTQTAGVDEVTGTAEELPLPEPEEDAVAEVPAVPAEESVESLPVLNGEAESVAEDTPNEEPELGVQVQAESAVTPTADVVEQQETTPGENDSAESSLEQSLYDAITRWVNAWESGHFGSYLAAYHEDFDPAYDDSRDAWEENRRVRINGIENMSISFDRLELLETGEDEALVRFWLYYSRAAYADETWKELQFRRQNDDWLILSERNLRIVTPGG